MYSYENINLRHGRRRREGSYGAEPPRDRTRDPSLTDRSVKQQILWIAGALAAFAVFYLTPVSEVVTNQILLPMVPIESDYDMGRQALRELPYVEVPRSTWASLLQSVSRDLVRTLENTQPDQSRWYVWNVAIVRSDAINAFALPGGVIRVTDTLLEALRPTRGELAALVGHEMGHVLHRHSQARLLQSKVVLWIIRALIYDDQDDEQETFGQALGELLAKSAAWLGQQRFSRLDEYQADATSWQLLVDASSRFGYNPQSLHSLLHKLWRLESGNTENKAYMTSVIEDWSRTHPATKDRLQALEQKWKALPFQERRRLGKNPV